VYHEGHWWVQFVGDGDSAKPVHPLALRPWPRPKEHVCGEGCYKRVAECVYAQEDELDAKECEQG